MRSYTECTCDNCGKDFKKLTKEFNRGMSRHFCERKCANEFRSKEFAKKNYKHGGAKTSTKNTLYKVWSDIRRRVRNIKRYQEVGICEEWLTWENFRDWAIGEHWEKGLHIHRIYNDRGYSPKNCMLLSASDHQTLHHKRG